MTTNSSIIFLVHEALSGNKQALAELNDIFEDNNLNRKKINVDVICDTSNAATTNDCGNFRFYKISSITEQLFTTESKNDSLELLFNRANEIGFTNDSERLGDVFNINYIIDLEENLQGIEDWLKRANLWLNICEKLCYTIPKTNTPVDWGLEQ